jgi:hypothetical protein
LIFPNKYGSGSQGCFQGKIKQSNYLGDEALLVLGLDLILLLAAVVLVSGKTREKINYRFFASILT